MQVDGDIGHVVVEYPMLLRIGDTGFARPSGSLPTLT